LRKVRGEEKHLERGTRVGCQVITNPAVGYSSLDISFKINLYITHINAHQCCCKTDFKVQVRRCIKFFDSWHI